MFPLLFAHGILFCGHHPKGMCKRGFLEAFLLELVPELGLESCEEFVRSITLISISNQLPNSKVCIYKIPPKLAPGTPWQSRGYNSTPPLQGTQVQSPGRGTKILHTAQHRQKTKTDLNISPFLSVLPDSI